MISSVRDHPVPERVKVIFSHFDIVLFSISMFLILLPSTSVSISQASIPASLARLHDSGVSDIPLCSIYPDVIDSSNEGKKYDP